MFKQTTNASVEPGNLPTGSMFDEVSRQGFATSANPSTAEVAVESPLLSDANAGTRVRDRRSSECAPLQTEMQDPPSTSSASGPTMRNGIVHPSAFIHQWLLEEFPDARLVISDDSVWMSVLNEEDVSFPDEEELITRILAMYNICYEDGLVTVEAKDNTPDLYSSL